MPPASTTPFQRASSSFRNLRELRGRVADDLEADVVEPLHHVGVLDRLQDARAAAASFTSAAVPWVPRSPATRTPRGPARPPRPASARWGTSESRLSAVTASNFILPPFTCVRDRAQVLERHVRVARDDVQVRGAAALVGDVDAGGARLLPEERGGEVVRGAGARRGEAHLVRVLLQVVDELRHVVGREVGASSPARWACAPRPRAGRSRAAARRRGPCRAPG